MKCLRCQHENPEGATFRNKCASPLQLGLACPLCGHAIPEGGRFCNNCAQPLDFAIAEFRQMKMQPSLERALRHKDILEA